MGVIIKHTKEDVTRFETEKCSNCTSLEACNKYFEDMQTHIPYCPKFFNFMIGYKSFIEEQMEWERSHPEEVEARRQRNLELAKKIQSQRRQAKKS